MNRNVQAWKYPGFCGIPPRVGHDVGMRPTAEGPTAASDTLLGQSACAVTFAVTSVMLLRVRSFRVPLLGLSGEDVTEQVHLSKLNIQSYLL